MAAFKDDFNPVCSCIPSHCLLQKQPSNHSKKWIFAINKIHYTLLRKSTIRPNINLNSAAKLAGDHKIHISHAKVPTFN